MRTCAGKGPRLQRGQRGTGWNKQAGGFPLSICSLPGPPWQWAGAWGCGMLSDGQPFPWLTPWYSLNQVLPSSTRSRGRETRSGSRPPGGGCALSSYPQSSVPGRDELTQV